ncbi:hypothetical protein LJC26_05625 [Desulfovibrio sp. OttesenSCG-928-O18]|nr:hypothetical protein [Desulfovibrio sp. OttesenSCG-928-O18]
MTTENQTPQTDAQIIPLFESGGISLYMSLGGALLLLAWGARQGLGSATQLGAVAFGLLGLYFFVNHIRRRKTPVMVLTPEGILFPGMETEVPWSVVADYSVKTKGFMGMATYTTFFIRLHEDDDGLPALSDGRINYYEGQSLIEIKIMRFSLKTQEVLDLFRSYLQRA